MRVNINLISDEKKFELQCIECEEKVEAGKWVKELFGKMGIPEHWYTFIAVADEAKETIAERLMYEVKTEEDMHKVINEFTKECMPEIKDQKLPRMTEEMEEEFMKKAIAQGIRNFNRILRWLDEVKKECPEVIQEVKTKVRINKSAS